MYEELNGGNAKNLKYIVQHQTTNEETLAATDTAYANVKPTALDRNTDKTWTFGDEDTRAGFLALLQTRNGQGFAYILVNHSAALGRRHIESIVTLALNPADKGARPTMYTVLTDPPKAEPLSGSIPGV